MKKKSLKTIFNVQWDELKVCLKAFFENADQEDLHDFRVRVKKLRAMLLLFDTSLTNSSVSKDFKPVREIFKKAGEIRNAYIHIQLGIKYNIDQDSFINDQQSKIDIGIAEFKRQEARYLRTVKKAHKRIENGIKPINNKLIILFCTTYIQQIATALNDLECNEKLHTCRKLIKTLLYNRKVTHDALAGKLQINMEYLDQLQNLIGDWHDNMLAIELFSTAGITDTTIQLKMKKQNTQMEKSIKNRVRNFGEIIFQGEKDIIAN